MMGRKAGRKYTIKINTEASFTPPVIRGVLGLKEKEKERNKALIENDGKEKKNRITGKI